MTTRQRQQARQRQQRRRDRVRAAAPPQTLSISVDTPPAWWVQAPRDGFTEHARVRLVSSQVQRDPLVRRFDRMAS